MQITAFTFILIVVTTDEEGASVVRVCVVIPGLKKKTFSKKDAANGQLDIKYESRWVAFLKIC